MYHEKDSLLLKKIKKAAVRTAILAGETVGQEFNKSKIRVNNKGGTEIVTPADLKSEKIILKIIRKHFPDHKILTEESGEFNNGNQSPWSWFIDPVDGTTNFSVKNPNFAVSIGIAYKNELILGIINAPKLKEFYFAEKGKGAYLNGKKIKVSRKNILSESFMTSGYSSKIIDRNKILNFYPKLFKAVKHHRDIGSAALELADVANGRNEGTILFGPRPFDVAAGVLLVREAGGKVTNFEGKEWTLQDKYLIASNGLVHCDLLKLI